MTDDQANRLYRFGDFVLDPLRYRLTRGPDLLSLPPRAFDVLVCLVERHGDVVTKDELLARVWPQTVVEENNLARQISTLRRALGDTRGQHEFIATIPAQGYRFVAPVARESRRPSGDRDTPPAVSIATAPPVEPEDSGDHGAEQERGGRATPPPSERLASGTLAAAAALLLVGVPLLWWSGSEAMSETAAGPGHLRRLTYGAGLQHQPAWSPDGRRVAFASDASGNSDIWIQEDGQPLPRALTSSPDAEWQPAWSPDGRWLAFRSERDGGGLYLMPAEGGDARRLTTFGHRPRWSPSGTHLLFSSSLLDGSKAAPWVVDVAAGGPRLLRPDVLSGYASAQVAWRPREDRISVWGRHRGGEWTFATMALDEGSEPVVSEIPGEIQRAMREASLELGTFSWAPAGTALYFEGQSGEVSNLWRVAVESRTLAWVDRPERLTLGAGIDRDFAISPDGRRVAFSSLAARTRLWAIGIDGTGRVSGDDVAVTSGSVGEYDAAAPRDGLRLAFRTTRGGQQQLWERSVDGGAERVLLSGLEAPESSPRWSSDGRTLAYARHRRAPGGGAVGLYDAATGRERIVAVSSAMEFVPDDWSADDSRILAACRTRGGGGYATCLLSLDPGADVAHARVIASDPSRSLICQRFSPDERWISFMAVDRARPGVSTLYVMPTQGGPWIPMTEGRSYDDKPRWSSDGRLLYFISDREGPLNVWAQRFDPAAGTAVGAPFQVTSFEDPARLVNTALQRVEIAVADDRIFLPLTDTSGDVWVLDLP